MQKVLNLQSISSATNKRKFDEFYVAKLWDKKREDESENNIIHK